MAEDTLPAQPVALEVFAAVDLSPVARAGFAVDGTVLPWLSLNAAVATSGGDGWSGAQYAATVRVHQRYRAGTRAYGGAVGFAMGPHGYRPFIGDADTWKWERAYMLRVQASLESSSRFRTRFYLEAAFVLNPDDASCPRGSYCEKGGTVMIGGGLTLAFGLL
jgi:hypothetical protein